MILQPPLSLRRRESQTPVRYRQNFFHRLPPCIRVLPQQSAIATKGLIVAGAAYGLIPARLAEALIHLGGLRHV